MKHIPSDEPSASGKEKDDAGGSDGSTVERSRRWVGKGRLEELLRQAGAWQVQQAWQRGPGPWTLKRWVPGHHRPKRGAADPE